MAQPRCRLVCFVVGENPFDENPCAIRLEVRYSLCTSELQVDKGRLHRVVQSFRQTMPCPKKEISKVNTCLSKVKVEDQKGTRIYILKTWTSHDIS